MDGAEEKLEDVMTLDIRKIRAQFPSLQTKDSGQARIYLDNPAGTQVPLQVMERVQSCFNDMNANLGGPFKTSLDAAQMVDEARAALADFLGAREAAEIIFGANMTTLTFHVGRSIFKSFKPGDDIIVSRMCHDANVQPWVLLAQDYGLNVRSFEFDPATYEYDLAALDDAITERTRFIALGYASNVFGTINPVKEVCARARQIGAISFIDAVAYAPHAPIDVEDLGCDFLVCSAYKFYGPHHGVLYGKRETLERLTPYKVRPAPNEIPDAFETGTQNHEMIAGLLGTMEYLESLGDHALSSRRARIKDAMTRLEAYEADLGWQVIKGLQDIPGVKIQGITNPNRAAYRVPTVSFTKEGVSPGELAKRLAARSIFCWGGHSYALEPLSRLDLLDKGGVLRLGIAHYNTAEEMETVVNILRQELA